MSLRPPDPEPSVPIWVLSFGDMITNLLAFFILLQSFSSPQKAELLQTGDAPITTTAADFGGMQWLFGRKSSQGWEYRLRKYSMEENPENLTLERVIDAEDEQIRKLFDDLRRSSDTRSSNDRKGATRVFLTPIRFAASGATLDAPAKDFLVTLASELTQHSAAPRLDISVIGTAQDADTLKAQYILSARRAQAVHDYLAEILPPDLVAGGTKVASWGAGVVREQGSLTAGSAPPSIVIAVAANESEE